MRPVKVEAPVYTVVSGTVGLTAEQAKSRLHNLQAVKGQVDDKPGSKTFRAGVYEVIKPVQFKQGEQFGYSGVVSKTGELRDPQAEELKRMEQAEGTEQAVKAAVAAERERCRLQFEAKLNSERAALKAGVDKHMAELEQRLRTEIRAELEAELKAGKK